MSAVIRRPAARASSILAMALSSFGQFPRPEALKW